ncbi:MAG: glycosyltransferase family 9 protein [Melioribacteraceae bacterium]|nr:glycosyltransferase family 9 protein [Melioribacteraceae bacterium]
MNLKKRILIVRTDRIGDVVLTLPLASIIKKYFPDSEVTFLVRNYTQDLTKNNIHIDNTIVLIEKNGKPSILKNILMLRNKFDICIVAFPKFWISFILFFSSIKLRIGTGYRWYSFLFTHKIYEHRKFGERHELEYNVNLLKPLGINESPQKDEVDFGIKLNENSILTINNFLLQTGINSESKLILIHPGSGGSAIDLPFKKLKLLVEKLSTRNDVMLIITGTEDERELCNSLIVNKNVINTAGKFNLEELITLISKVDLVVANSTGPIHIAAALQKQIIGFYPKFAAVSPKRWGPYTSKSIIFQPTICDGNCNRKKCENLDCMNSIEVDEILNSINNFITVKN